MIRRSILVQFQVEGWHCWPEAVDLEGREYLASKHRHLWHIKVQLDVRHNDREIELHDLRDFCFRVFKGGDVGRLSCENLALDLLTEVTRRYADRRVTVWVLEDGENGAVVSTDHPGCL